MSFHVSFCSCVFSPFSIAITSLGEERANLSAFRTFARFVLVWICRFPLPLGVWEMLRFVIVALPGLFSYLFLPKPFTIVGKAGNSVGIESQAGSQYKRNVTHVKKFHERAGQETGYSQQLELNVDAFLSDNDDISVADATNPIDLGTPKVT